MKFLREGLDKVKPHFEKGGKLEKYYYPFEAIETFLFAPNHTTPNKGAHIRDAIDLKRLMTTVIVAMIPCLLFGMWNVGYQHFLATGEAATFGEQFLLGAIHVLPIVVVAYAAGLGVEFVFSIVRKHPINEGFLVTGMLIPLIMPVTIPLWQVALATIFAVLIGKEVFGGTGMNILNVALTARAFLYFAYPTDISGEVWTYFGNATPLEGYTGATPLAIAQSTPAGESVVDAIQNASFIKGSAFVDLFMGYLPGSIGETSTLMCLIGAALLILTGVGSWKIILSAFAGAYGMGLLFNALSLNPYMAMPAEYQLVIGGLAFGIVFMATDPVTAAHTELGKWIYGALIGILTVIIRVVNPAYPEGIMLAILLMNVFAPLIDHYVVQANKNRRLRRATV
ncbi:NADH:ubiquinone reductase (Na(+)-transporting) subunit B [Aureibacter tunicatorum]|uniref:Na(+)-translocating NADH-quinone reductase subunit B n=1 Tax=Aureibacter tunicatorum TaxID=866807 RepID=A0AAE3XPI0_9BACT|nr:NADH:ubiquinone reductase (Na(+)-transporting) subunit B [Aureibacter tunicatorum]MDR6240217.1 Na+-transporting NADH:ubiquinone oxidoreductase subunit B [Aureibacter tunicatorum]BDD05902.1 Na(+)-translocating NADH-quinone reductase subunit B [Aureibacter tunicatorum]